MDGRIEAWLSAVDRMPEDPYTGYAREFFHEHSGEGPVLRVRGLVLFVGKLKSIREDNLDVEQWMFRPCHGFAPSVTKLDKLNVSVEGLHRRALDLREGDAIVCSGRECSNMVWETLTLDKDTVVVHWPVFEKALPYNGLYMSLQVPSEVGLEPYAGLLSPFLPFRSRRRSLSMEVWSKEHGAKFSSGKTPPKTAKDLGKKIGICTSVADHPLLHKCSSRVNTVTMASPPCISWSKGGRLGGLNTGPGFAMVELVMLVEVQQPLLLFLECANDTLVHDHFPIVEAMLSILGFRRTWQQVVPLHHLTNNYRTRWLAVKVAPRLAEASHLTHQKYPKVTRGRSPTQTLW